MALLQTMVTTVGLIGGFGGLVLVADRLLVRRIRQHTTRAWSGYLITGDRHPCNGGGVWVTSKHTVNMIPPSKWWLCFLPWPGKQKWAETVQAKAALLGATFNYVAVSAWDWDEAWVIEVDAENIIASSNKTATALAFLKHKGVAI